MFEDLNNLDGGQQPTLDGGQQPSVNPAPAPAEPTDGGGQPPVADGGQQPQQPQQPNNQDSAFARMRRAMEQQFQNSYEYRLAQKMAERYGMTPEQLMQKLEEAELAQQAQQMQVSPEVLRQQQYLQQRLEQLEQERAAERIKSEIAQFRSKQEYANVTDDELGVALQFLGQMHRAGMKDFTLEQAFKATNPNYESYLREQIRQQVVQEYAQNGKAPLPPKGGAAPTNIQSAFDLPDDKFEEMLQRVKRGERITKF